MSATLVAMHDHNGTEMLEFKLEVTFDSDHAAIKELHWQLASNWADASSKLRKRLNLTRNDSIRVVRDMDSGKPTTRSLSR